MYTHDNTNHLLTSYFLGRPTPRYVPPPPAYNGGVQFCDDPVAGVAAWAEYPLTKGVDGPRDGMG